MIKKNFFQLLLLYIFLSLFIVGAAVRSRDVKRHVPNLGMARLISCAVRGP